MPWEVFLPPAARISRKGLNFLYSTCLRPHLKYCTQCLEHLPCERRLRDRGLFSLQKRWLQGDWAAACLYLQVGHQANGARFLTVQHGRTRHDGHKLKQERFRLEKENSGKAKKVCILRKVKHWNMLPREAALESFKTRVYKALYNLVRSHSWPCF